MRKWGGVDGRNYVRVPFPPALPRLPVSCSGPGRQGIGHSHWNFDSRDVSRGPIPGAVGHAGMPMGCRAPITSKPKQRLGGRILRKTVYQFESCCRVTFQMVGIVIRTADLVVRDQL